MTTKTCIIEGIVGLISAGMFLRLFPIALTMQNLVHEYYAANISNTPIIISTATLIFCISLFGLIAVYCLGVCLEKIVFCVIEHTKKTGKWL